MPTTSYCSSRCKSFEILVGASSLRARAWGKRPANPQTILSNRSQLINNAGYFPKGEDDLGSLNFDKELLAIDVCAIGPLRISASLINAGLLGKGSKIINITS